MTKYAKYAQNAKICQNMHYETGSKSFLEPKTTFFALPNAVHIRTQNMHFHKNPPPINYRCQWPAHKVFYRQFLSEHPQSC
jgi:hypothetical protein